LYNISILKIFQENLHKKPKYPHDDDCLFKNLHNILIFYQNIF
jgi:hypothetical protein